MMYNKISYKNISNGDKMKLQQQLNEIKFTSKQLELFEKLGFTTVFDLISKYPSRYNFIIETELIDSSKVVVQAKIISDIKIAFYQGKKNRIYFDVEYNGSLVKVVIFNRSFLMNHLKNASIITILGTYTEKNNTIVAADIKFRDLASISGIYPVYSLNNHYKNNDYLKVVANVLKSAQEDITNVVPQDLVEVYKLINKKDAIINIHFPKSNDLLLQANRALIYEEFFIFALQSIIKKNNTKVNKDLIKEINTEDIAVLTSLLKYTLTKDQRNALNDIYKDFMSPYAMNRLLLADVGSGKTLVALISAYMIYMCGFQTAFMAPTTILAMQHYNSALEIFQEVEINIALLTSSTHPQERISILEDLKKGKIDLLIGTHSIYQDDVIFKKLGFVIYDEQQRFGVNQRKSLREKGQDVEQLMLSATPIPRTLAQAAYASISVSYMKDPLPFKKPIISKYFKSKSIKPFYKEMLELLAKKQQIYIVTPLVEESESIDTKNVLDVFENIEKHFGSQYKVGLLHGKLDNETKQDTMEKFVNHEFDILVATSLIEVGISVDNANCIIIYDAHRFGLSQLHQLRGRVGRGEQQGYCIFLSSSSQPETIEKMEFISSHNDGFEIAEFDLQMRGPGDLLGIKQSGMPSFNLANLIKDEKIYKLAYQDALNLFNNKDKFKEWYLVNRNILNAKQFYLD